MKVWRGYGSEHSMNLVMIGRFKTAADAAEAKDVIEQLTDQVREEPDLNSDTERYSEVLLGLLTKLKVHHVGPSELEQFAYGVSIKLSENQVELRTDEVEVSAFLKVLVDKGARVEVYSAHDYPDPEETSEK